VRKEIAQGSNTLIDCAIVKRAFSRSLDGLTICGNSCFVDEPVIDCATSQSNQ